MFFINLAATWIADTWIAATWIAATWIAATWMLNFYRVHTDPEKVWKVMEFKVEIFQVWKIVENDLRYGKVWKSHGICDC